jgi:excinuclease ABC subunit C
MKIDLKNLPNNPGCYLFKNKNKEILYIGKAKNLKKRVSSYFQKKNLDTKTIFLVSHIETLDFIVTDNEVEALILENNLIKKHKPKYNIDLKDSKRYAYIEITNEDYPRIVIARNNEGKGTYFGPFTSGISRDHILYTLKKTFRLRTCKRFPKRACLRHSIGLCDAPCVNLISKIDYDKKISAIKMILSGKTKELITRLKKQMKIASKNENYEKAIEYRNQIDSLINLSEKQKMERGKKYNEDIINYTIKKDQVYLMLFNIDRGTIINKQEFIFKKSQEFFSEFLLQYYSSNNIPGEIIIPEKIEEIFKEYLENIKKSKVKINIPKRGEKKELLKLVKKNIELTFFSNSEKLEELQKQINLEDTPHIIECFDISHLGGTNLVGSMVQFRNAIPYKTNYRKFKIRSFKGIDDTRAMAEVVFRRYSHLKEINGTMPDLIVIDGGRGQLNYALKELKKLNLKIPIISLAKRLEEVFTPEKSESIIINKKSSALKLLQNLRDEAHRFAINYNKLLRSRELLNN